MISQIINSGNVPILVKYLLVSAICMAGHYASDLRAAEHESNDDEDGHVERLIAFRDPMSKSDHDYALTIKESILFDYTMMSSVYDGDRYVGSFRPPVRHDSLSALGHLHVIVERKRPTPGGDGINDDDADSYMDMHLRDHLRSLQRRIEQARNDRDSNEPVPLDKRVLALRATNIERLFDIGDEDDVGGGPFVEANSYRVIVAFMSLPNDEGARSVTIQAWTVYLIDFQSYFAVFSHLVSLGGDSSFVIDADVSVGMLRRHLLDFSLDSAQWGDGQQCLAHYWNNSIPVDVRSGYYQVIFKTSSDAASDDGDSKSEKHGLAPMPLPPDTPSDTAMPTQPPDPTQ